jgi:ABC-type sugar transport system permease subunit
VPTTNGRKGATRAATTAKAEWPRRGQPAHWRWQWARAFAVGLAPAFFVLAAITVGPTLYLILTSLTPADPVHPYSLADFSHPLGNYRTLIGDSEFINSLSVQAKLLTLLFIHRR